MRRYGSPALLLAVLLFTLLPGERARASSAELHGKVSREGEVTAGARVFAYRSFEDVLAERAAAISEVTGEEGTYRLDLAPGTYYLLAKKGQTAPDGSLPVGAFLSFHGSNPFTLPAGRSTEVNFPLARRSGEAVVGAGDDQGSGTLTGVVAYQGQGMAGVKVRLYLDAEGDFRGMGYATAPPTGEDGSFRFDYLPESTYYIVARKRAAGGSGPIGEGDYYGFFVDNPLRVEAGKAVAVDVELVSKARDAGTFDKRPRPTGTRIAGRITDAGGKPVPGAYAFAYREKLMSHKRPAFISEAAGEDGAYAIHLSEGGTYYIGARSDYGDSPAKGEWYGRYNGSPDHSLRVAEGETVKGVDIMVERILGK